MERDLKNKYLLLQVDYNLIEVLQYSLIEIGVTVFINWGKVLTANILPLQPSYRRVNILNRFLFIL